MEYIILHDEKYSYLIFTVNDYIKKGWEPQGGISATRVFNVISGKSYPDYYQAMIKRDKQENKGE